MYEVNSRYNKVACQTCWNCRNSRREMFCKKKFLVFLKKDCLRWRFPFSEVRDLDPIGKKDSIAGVFL